MIQINFFQELEWEGAWLKVTIHPDGEETCKQSRQFVYKLIDSNVPVYGFTTGVGANKDKKVEADYYNQYNTNMVRSHCRAWSWAGWSQGHDGDSIKYTATGQYGYEPDDSIYVPGFTESWYRASGAWAGGQSVKPILLVDMF